MTFTVGWQKLRILSDAILFQNQIFIAQVLPVLFYTHPHFFVVFLKLNSNVTC
jgi:hypothetical protein